MSTRDVPARPIRDVQAAPCGQGAGATISANVEVVRAAIIRVAFLHGRYKTDTARYQALLEKAMLLSNTCVARANRALMGHALVIERTDIAGRFTGDPPWYEIDLADPLTSDAEADRVLPMWVKEVRAKTGLGERHPEVVPVFFAQYQPTGHNGHTVTETAGGPAILMDVDSASWDGLTLLHEIGHVAGLDHDYTIDRDKACANIMWTADHGSPDKPTRNQFTPAQLRAFSKLADAQERAVSGR